MRKNIFRLADSFEKKLKRLATSNYPDAESVLPIINSVVAALKKSNPLLAAVKSVATPVDVQNNGIENISSVYFQLIVQPQKYEELLGQKVEVSNLLKPAIEQALNGLFHTWQFKVQVGIVS